jgi:hypothetical protein
MAMVQCRKLLFIEPLDDGQNGGVHESHIGVGVAIAELTNASVILRPQLFDTKGASDDIVEERNERTGMHADVHPVVDLCEDRRRDDERLFGLLDQRPARRVIGVAAVQRRVQRTSIKD